MRKTLLSFLLIVILMITSIVTINAETIYVNKLNFTNNSTQTIVISNAMNKTDFENMLKLVQYLKEQQEYNKQHEEYLNSLVERVGISEERFTDTLKSVQEEKTIALKDLEIERQARVNYENRTTVKIQTLTTNIAELREDNYKQKMWTIIFSVIFSILSMIFVAIVYELHRSKKLFFIYRWLRANIFQRFT